MSHHSIWTAFVEAILIKLVLVGAILYAWGAICFLFLKCWRLENTARMHDFLRLHYPFFARLDTEKITVATMHRAGRRGWRFAGLPLMVIGYDSRMPRWLEIFGNTSAVLLLFFGGLFLAYGWYGVRCLRLLNLDSLEDGELSLSSLPPETNVAR
jgi:hypothetical protein